MTVMGRGTLVKAVQRGMVAIVKMLLDRDREADVAVEWGGVLGLEKGRSKGQSKVAKLMLKNWVRLNRGSLKGAPETQ